VKWPSKTRIAIALGIGLVLVTALLAFRIYWYDPNLHIQDLDWLGKASAEEIRQAAERTLWFPWGDHHDACLLLEHVGNSGSLPYLLKALERFDKPTPTRLRPCSYFHCVDALKAITGLDPGIEPEDWAAALSGEP